MRLTIHPDIFPRFPGLSIAVAVASGLDNAASRPGVNAAWYAAWTEAQAAAASYGNAQSHPRVRPWRERFTALGGAEAEAVPPGEVGRPVAEVVLGEFQPDLRDHFGLASAGFPLDERHASVEW